MTSLHPGPGLMYSVGAIWPPVCTIVVIGRLMTRNAQRTKLGLDDWLVVPALLFVWAMGATAIAGTALGALGYPTPPPSSPEKALVETSYQQVVTRKIYLIMVLVHTIALTLIKVSCMLFYRRIFGAGVSKAVQKLMFVIIGIIIAWGVSFFFSFVFICDTHIEYAWGSLADFAKCVDSVKLNYGLTISDVITDFIIMIFPMPLIWRLQMSVARKFAVTFIFFLGTLAAAASITRMVIGVETSQAQFQQDIDEDFLSTVAFYFMIHEASFGLCAICLPTLSGALKLKGIQDFLNSFPSIFSSHSRSPRQSLYDPSSKEQRQRFGSEHSESNGSDLTDPRHALEPNERLGDTELQLMPQSDEAHFTKRSQLEYR